MKQRFIILLVVVLLPWMMQAQESLTGLHQNTAIMQYLQNRTSNIKRATTTHQEPLQLPFFDDFTYPGPYPDSTLWSDNNVFINSSFQKNPFNRGVATFDALDAYGQLHEGASQFAFIADLLTSQKIRTDSVLTEQGLRKLTDTDSLFLSFYYQPQGMGNNPEPHDSLVLEFFMEYADTSYHVETIYVPNDTLWINSSDHEQGWDSIILAHWDVDSSLIIKPEKWAHIWSSEGMSLDEFYTKQGNRWMVPVMIPITDTVRFFRPDFRFRFRNYASLASHILPSWQSNMDHWNVDYVYFNYNRFKKDTTYHDVSFVNPGETFLNIYTAMPYKQYIADSYNAMRSQFSTTFSNLDNVAQNVSYKYRIYDQNGQQVGSDGQYSSIEWTNPLQPAVTVGNITDTVDVLFSFPINAALDSASFTIKQWITGDQTSGGRLSDSIEFVQNMSNYFAYDDGVPEAGYGLTPAGAMMALRFPLNTRDYLRAVDIFFNSTLTRQGSGYIEDFDLMVWSDNHNEPGEVLYMHEEMLSAGEAGKFKRFYIREELPVASGFFVGIRQRTNDNMNVGFDFSNNVNTRLLYKVLSDPWQISEFEGCAMIRPVLGAPLDIPGGGKLTTKSQPLLVSPNPLNVNNKQFSLYEPSTFLQEHEMMLQVYDAVGRKVYEAKYHIGQQVAINEATQGLYVVRLLNKTTGEKATTKLVITQ